METKQSTLTVAYDYLKESKEAKSFSDIWNHVKDVLSLEDEGEAISKFYTNLTLDGRFVGLAENTWDLRERVEYSVIEKINKEMNEFYVEDDLSDKVSEDDDEENDEIEDAVSSKVEDEEVL